jgi:2-polyprenyl-6-hydroxyphenyl methylase/3-demethylubiquinone-9 3-methyltransferase
MPQEDFMSVQVQAQHALEVERGARFRFGRNWRSFLSTLDDDRIAHATASLREMLGCDSLAGKRFLDIGCGSGLFSLAARRLGATVVSFDFDPASAECARILKQRETGGDSAWTVLEGSVLDRDFVESLGRFDIVYAWGVLHHTGGMWRALEHAGLPVESGGQLFVAIYNDQGLWSKAWVVAKRAYCANTFGRALVLGVFVPYLGLRGLVSDLHHGVDPRRRYVEYRRQRGMSIVHDWIDWLGGYPFEVATPRAIVDFYVERGFEPMRVHTVTNEGNNQFVFRRRSAAERAEESGALA